MKQSLKILSGCLLLASVFPSQTWAAGFAYDDLTAGAAASANAVVAGADDLSAAVYNPSGLAWQEGVQVMLGSLSRTRNMKVELNGNSYAGADSAPDLGLLAISWLPEGERWGVAASIVTPYSLKTDWSAAFPDQLGETYLNMQRYAADVFWRGNNTLGVSMGLDVYDSTAKLSQGTASFSASNWSKVGAHAGLRWEFAPFWILGATVRQGADVSFSSQDNSRLDISLPDEITIAIAHNLLDDEMRLELDVKHTKWSAFSDLNVVNATGSPTPTPRTINFRDTNDIAIGSTWFWRNDTQLRFGYAYQDAANKLDSFQPAIADQVGHRFSTGIGGLLSGMHFDLSYAYVYYPTVDVTGDYAGAYNDAKSSFMFALTKKF